MCAPAISGLCFPSRNGALQEGERCPAPSLGVEPPCGAAHGADECGQQGSGHPRHSRAVLEGLGAPQAGTGAGTGPPLPSSHHHCQAAASGLCPCAVPRLIIPGRRRRAAVLSPLQEPSPALPPPPPPPPAPASLLGALCAQGCCCLFCATLPQRLCAGTAWCCLAFQVPCPVPLLWGDAKTSIPPSLPPVCPEPPAQLPSLISPHGHRRSPWIFSFWRKKFSLK